MSKSTISGDSRNFEIPKSALNRGSLAYTMYNAWAEETFGRARSARWEDLRQHQIQAWYEAADRVLHFIEHCRKRDIETAERDARWAAQAERAKARRKARRQS